jgi:predicted restriction endonuclease
VGFDVQTQTDFKIQLESSHAPLKCSVCRTSNHEFIVGLSMSNVVHALITNGEQVIDSSELSFGGLLIAGAFKVLDISELETFLKRAWQLSRTLPNALIGRFEKALAAVSTTEREATVMQRVGQTLFREGLLALWGGRCAITGLDAPELLRASHAKPWADSSDIERLDVFNGLLLAAHWDAAFDSGLITVSTSGHVVTSAALSDATKEVLRVSDALKIRVQAQHEPYLKWHREFVFKKNI